MKKSVLTILIFIVFSGFLKSQDYWLRVPSPTTRWLTKCSLVDTLYGWAAGDSGTVINTTNGGNNWTIQNSGIFNYPIEDIFFLNRRLGWALSNDYFVQGTLLTKTTNGGINWVVSRLPDSAKVYTTIFFIDSLNGFITGFSGNINKTTNGGTSWFETYVDSAYCPVLYLFPKKKISFLNSLTGFACGGHMDIAGIIWKTTNAGLHWFTFCVGPEPLFDIKPISGTRIVSTGGDLEFGASTVNSYDGGNIWLYDTTSLPGQGQNLAFRTPAELWLPLSFSQIWGLNLDSGKTGTQWIGIQAPDSTSVYAAQFVSPTCGWGFGSNGAILKYNSSVIGITPTGTQLPDRNSLSQNYPNPFNPSTVLKYFLVKPGHVKITIYDLLGKEVKVYFEGIRPAGDNTFRFVNFGLSSGIYIYKVTSGDFSDSKKMVIIK
ncbi:MAG: T9SS type A sorting domain-containing protein [Ignavibacteria bacterium]|nr:T9SS type A sorting domain-containing protein [Ignavibacteria bacterium]MCC7158259.1 T9SS type A sorting domain-containing protein [Ignavibacteria bacterium]